jgi:hypothetical protein
MRMDVPLLGQLEDIQMCLFCGQQDCYERICLDSVIESDLLWATRFETRAYFLGGRDASFVGEGKEDSVASYAHLRTTHVCLRALVIQPKVTFYG